MPIEIVPNEEAMKKLDEDSETYKRLKRKYGDKLENLLDKSEEEEDKHKGLKPGQFRTEPDPEAPDGMRRVRQAVKSGGLVGGQKKLDKNKDGNISDADFAMMRKNYAYGGRVAKMSAEKS
tara:strand:+ start:309 stop:671 length:363 start_codon:yes stop_codon:yes gene_type:complete